MHFFLLDAGGAYLGYMLGLIFLGLATLLEAIVLLVMKFNNAARCFLDALVVNLVSLVAGYLLIRFALPNSEISEGSGALQDLGIMFVATMIVEGSLLMLLNRSKTAGRVWTAALVMNVVTYILLAIISLN
ncbi:MAG TPA: hypothetical protein VEB63_10610 [Chitinophagaceae bacterium]|nr:hypothetical protein [Chitinophagaceae bacterium]